MPKFFRSYPLGETGKQRSIDSPSLESQHTTKACIESHHRKETEESSTKNLKFWIYFIWLNITIYKLSKFVAGFGIQILIIIHALALLLTCFLKNYDITKLLVGPLKHSRNQLANNNNKNYIDNWYGILLQTQSISTINEITKGNLLAKD